MIELTLKNPTEIEEKAHRWRRCPMGKHLVREHPKHVLPSETHPEGMVTTVQEHCAYNLSHKDELSYDEIQYIAETYFSDLRGLPTANALLELFPKSDDYDVEIRGWTQYWNDIFKSSDPLDPNLVKALIATESSFEKNPPKQKAAHGLMQITDKTFPILSDIHGELKNYLVRVSAKELLEPSANICIGVRWLFRKKETASNRLGREATWFEAVEDYKSVLKKRLEKEKYNLELMRKFHEYYQPLQEAKNKALDR